MLSILIVDNNDSFTFNLVETFRQTFLCKVTVIALEKIDDINIYRYDGIVLSPGPGLPREKNGLFDFIEKVQGGVPLLGVCLGHQAIAEFYGGNIVQLSKIIHGESSIIQIQKNDRIFTNLPEKIEAGRYHSWVVENHSLPKELETTSQLSDNTIMSLAHKTKNINSVQFHPESILTPLGPHILKNWLIYCIEQK